MGFALPEASVSLAMEAAVASRSRCRTIASTHNHSDMVVSYCRLQAASCSTLSSDVDPNLKRYIETKTQSLYFISLQ